MKHPLLALALLLVLLSGCDNGDFHPVSRVQTLPSGANVTVTMLDLVWGARPGDDGCVTGSDCFHLEFVSKDPNAELPKRIAEAQADFELIRPMSEQWGFKSAEMLGFKQVERKGDYDLFFFTRAADGKWSCEHKDWGISKK